MNLKHLVAALAVLTLSACPGGETGDDGGTDGGADLVEVTDDISADTTWTADKAYQLKRHIFVTGGTLTIEAGTTVLGDQGASLVITRNARLDAVGTATSPIVFTSSAPAGQREAGQWGGVALLGSAPINVTGGTDNLEGFPVTAGETAYGGGDPAHDCGTLAYARIEFAGFELAPDNELNGLTVAGCGTGTTLHHLQIHLGADDGVEMFGGTADLRHVLITQPDDDGLDWDQGWQGRVQYLVIQQNATVGNCAFESDSSSSTPDATPRSAPEIWNATLVGSDAAPGTAGKDQIAMHLRRGTAGRLHRFVIAHFTDLAVDVDGDASVAQANGGALYLRDSVLLDNGDVSGPAFPADDDSKDGAFDEAAFFFAGELNNQAVDPQLTAATELTAPDFRPAAGSPVLALSGDAPTDPFFDATDFAGAMGTEDWTAGWSAYPSN